jgi:hypothetical protein
MQRINDQKIMPRAAAGCSAGTRMFSNIHRCDDHQMWEALDDVPGTHIRGGRSSVSFLSVSSDPDGIGFECKENASRCRRRDESFAWTQSARNPSILSKGNRGKGTYSRTALTNILHENGLDLLRHKADDTQLVVIRRRW